MTQVWIVKHNGGVYVFKDLETAEASIKDTFKAAYSVEKDEVVSHESYTFTITQDGRIQDRVTVNAFEVYESPAVMPHILFADDDQDRRPTERVRKEF